MSNARNPILESVRIIPRDGGFLDRKLGARGEVFFDQEDNTLRLYDGTNPGGIPLLRADLENVEGVIGAALGDNPPTGETVRPGTLWFNTANGRLYVLYNDGNSVQWVQPQTPSFGSGGGGGGGGSGTVSSGIQNRLAFYSSSGTTVDDLPEIEWSANRLSIDGSFSATGQKNYLRFHWENLSDLNSEAPAEDWHGMIAHVHATGRVYFAHAGVWNALANFEDLAAASASFNTISVSGQSNIVADSASDTLNLVAGPNITITTNSSNDSITISATSSGGGAGGVSTGAINRLAYYAATGNVIQDTGSNLTWNGSALSVLGAVNATSFSGNGELLTGLTKTAFSTITVTGQPNVVAEAVQDTLSLIAGTGITITTNATNDSITIGSSIAIPNSFSTVSVSGQSNVVADSTTDTLNLVAGSNITITTDANTDSITISAATSSGGGAINDLTDVTISSPQLGQVLKYNGTIWINDSDATAGGTTNLNDLGDVTISLPSTNHVLKYNGTTWINAPEDAVSVNSFSTISVSGQNEISADSSSDTLTVVAGSGISITTNSSTDTLTISSTVSGGSTTFSALTDATSASLTVDKFYLPAITKLVVTNNLALAYRFDQYGTVDNPTIYAISGTTIAFDLNAAGHPFQIEDGIGNPVNTGLIHVSISGIVSTGSSAQRQSSGTLYWKIPYGISGGYRYQCTSHAPMVGSISIKAFNAI